MGSLFRVFGFMGEVLGMVRQNPMLLLPLVANLVIAVGVNFVLAIASFLLPPEYYFANFLLTFVGITALYFIDYFAAGLTTSMVYDQVTTGNATLGPAMGRTLRASIGIVIFAAISAALDMLAQAAQRREGVMRIVGPMIMMFLRAVWTTATYVVMPSMIIEQHGFFAAFRRSKQLMENDPTQVGVGFIGIGALTSLIGVVTLGAAGFAFNFVSSINLGQATYPLAILASLTMTNLFWSLSSYIRGTYYTCFYLWALECERNQSANPAFAPAPLRNVLATAA